VKVGIVGLGQIGGSLALALKKTGKYRITGMDISEEIREAISGKIDGVTENYGELKNFSEIVILAVPVREIKKLLGIFRDFSGIVMDTGSTKVEVMEEARKYGFRFVGGHPLAGTEKIGPESWSSSLFQGTPFFLTGNLRKKDRVVVENLVRDTGANPVWIEPEIHDRIMAYTSHMPYVLALALTHLSSKFSRFWGPGIKSTTRLAAQNPEMALDILFTNRKNIEDALQDFSNVLMELKILMRDPEELRKFLEEIYRKRREVDGSG